GGVRPADDRAVPQPVPTAPNDEARRVPRGEAGHPAGADVRGISGEVRPSAAAAGRGVEGADADIGRPELTSLKRERGIFPRSRFGLVSALRRKRYTSLRENPIIPNKATAAAAARPKPAIRPSAWTSYNPCKICGSFANTRSGVGY